MKLKICLVTSNGYPKGQHPSMGGVQQVVQAIAKEFTASQHDVHVFIPGKASNVIVIDGVNIHYVQSGRYKWHNNSYTNSYLQWVYDFIFNVRTIICISSINPDVIHIHNLSNISIGLIIKLTKGIPYGVTIHGPWGGWIVPNPFPYFLKRYWKCFPTITRASFISVVHEVEAKKFEKDFSRMPVVIQNGVKQSFFQNQTSKKIQSPINPVVICVGRLVSVKRFDVIIRSMRLIVQTYPSAKLYVVGDGLEQNNLLSLVQQLNLTDNVILTGVISDADLVRLYRESTVFVMASVYETFALTSIEAATFGLPLVSTPIGVGPDLIDRYKNGIVVHFDSDEDIASAVIYLHANPDEYETMSKHSILASKNYDWGQISKQYEKLYYDALGKWRA